MPSVSLATLSVSSANSTSPPSGNLPEQACDADGYIINTVKKHSEYNNKDLPMPSDHCWSQSFIPMATLWCSVQKNIWSVPNEELASALQLIFNVMYPDIKHQVTTSGSVFLVVGTNSIIVDHELTTADNPMSQWVAEQLWLICPCYDVGLFLQSYDDVNICPVAEFLKSEYWFLWENPNLIDTVGLYHETFLLKLIAMAHLSSIAACVHVPGWDTQAMALAAVSSILFHFSILINCCQLEHAIKFVVDSTIDVEQVLKDMANNTDGKMKVKLLKVLNRAMGHVTSLAFQFLAMNWNSNTTAYQESIHKWGQVFVQATFTALQAYKPAGIKSGNSEADVNEAVGAPNPHSFLCEILFDFQLLVLLQLLYLS